MGLLARLVARLSRRTPEVVENNVLRGLSLFDYSSFVFAGGMHTVYGNIAGSVGEEHAPNSFTAYVNYAYKSSGVVAACLNARLNVFSQLRFQFQRQQAGREGELWGDQSLRVLESPWPGGTTQNLLARILQHADLAGNAYVWRNPDNPARLRVLRPDWVTIVYGTDRAATAEESTAEMLAAEVLGYVFSPHQRDPEFLPADEVAHFAPLPDPEAEWRGMSWLTPVLRNIESHQSAGDHKTAYFERSATPNMIITLDPQVAAENIRIIADLFNEEHAGTLNAYKTLFLGGGMDATVVGSSMADLAFKDVQGVDEALICAAAGVPASIVGLAGTLTGGSSLNSGNYESAKRQFGDMTISALGQEAAGSLQSVVPAVPGSRLWYDTRDVPFFREDAAKESEIRATDAGSLRALLDAGYTPESAAVFVDTGDFKALMHSGLFSVQLQPPTLELAPVAAPAALPPPEEDIDGE